ncbi:hypothetical protein CERSUDRAFT_112963 [Gelatoporia subvermispora B]|uniref:Uncharacterized protein n=1 Tax=Ceriporiopsis subvermispora (strain B) TaxID=914234 RepID=M2QQG3_CERS8|nr:hypothetical protein CERSUDRAFT_112963 [Gelatoporia subvermispora B]
MARSDVVLNFKLDMAEAGLEYEDIEQIDTGLAHHLEIWRNSFSTTIFDIDWPDDAWDIADEGLPWLEWIRDQWPRLDELGMPFDGRHVRAELSHSTPICLSWTRQSSSSSTETD